ncbi:MAG: prepilin-type N-terminal cleavage/methylation domain-containing protein [Deltaproteobacteria bacterium]|nr:prepilin-type N-terminal cleavage/methylation domain-containing protein [Deltaproteobacteria bacterium]NND27943.1 prepilin-type N-terminal cleavage/methylation domain-containing protein [Myxococcales bacterium]MBT8463104.1 prepilin-type N-terminal cleavage/methylation domain-containing protein [Deltaproteobacteria bacterium]MBT8482846.1 prepilin-type N-terminal cleavage/methylation domain-containing protein [Deltaproteobacteria bacterium]NNK08063.1 prepilin-type N-terminal cleavage/methylati
MPNTTDTRARRRLARRRRRDGFTLIEIMIVITIFAMMAGGVAVALLPQLEKARLKTTKTDAQGLRSAVMLYVADNPRGCPTVEDLVNERYLDGTRRTTDAWDTPFQITCEDGDIAVVSAGPDLQFNTEDDI